MSRKYRRTFIVSVLVTATAAAAALAQGQSAHPLGVYASMDSNHDGRVSLAEFEAAHAAQLSHFDTDKDGSVAIAEIDAFFAGHLGQGPGADLARRRLAGLKSADTNGDGVVSVEEFKVLGDAEFHQADSNGDGFIDAAEADKAVP